MRAEIVPETLADLVASTLEDAAFVFAEPVEPAPAFPSPVLEARLDFGGADGGELAIVATVPLSRSLAANLLGLEPDEPETRQRAGDALGEFVNMLAGSVMLALYGPKAQTRIGVPTVRELPSAPVRHGGTSVSLTTEEGERIDAFVGPPPPGAP
jgi:hypothetical protein